MLENLKELEVEDVHKEVQEVQLAGEAVRIGTVVAAAACGRKNLP